MGPFVAALAYTWISHGLAFVLMPWSIPLSQRIRAIVLWAFAAILLFFLQDFLLLLVLVAIAMALLSPIDPVQRVSYFLIAVPCVPAYLTAQLPFPGLNYLLELTQYKTASIVLLLPLYVVGRYGALRLEALSLLGACMLFYAVYTAMIVGISVNATMGMRHLLEMLLTLALPYYVIRYAVWRLDHIETIFKYFLVASIVLASIVLVSSLKQWDFYELAKPLAFYAAPDTRAGFVRIHATANPHSLAFHFAAALILLEFLKKPMKISWLYLMGLRMIFLVSAYFTNSHGGLLGMLVGVAMYRFFLIRSALLRTTLLGFAISWAIVGGLWLLYGSTDSFDKYGTFNYRQEVFRIGFGYVLQVPLFGDYDFYKNPVFEPLRQGLGIIDITNLYLQILLHFGFLGALPFFVVMAAPIIALLRMSYSLSADQEGQRSRLEEDEAVQRWRSMAAVIFGILWGWLALVATTSDVALTVHIGIVFAALGRGLADLGMAAAKGKSESKAVVHQQLAMNRRRVLRGS